MILPARERAFVDAWLADLLAGVYQPRPELSIWEWAEQTLRIPASENADMAGQLWSSALTPYVRTVMEWVREPGKKEMFITKSSQIGITMAVIIIIIWFIVHQPINIGYYIDSVEEARKISKTRLRPWIVQNKILDEIGEDEDDMSNLTYFFKGMTVYLMGSHSGGGFRNKQLALAILDELDAHPYIEGEGTTADLARTRVKVPENSKLLGFSSPTVESAQTWQEYLSGTQEKLFVKCPHCGHMQPLEWQRMRFDHCRDLSEEYDTELLERDTYYECEMGCRIEQREKPRLFERLEWRATAKAKKPNKRSLLISDLYSPFVSWGTLAVEWIEAQGSTEKLQKFINHRLAEAYRSSGGQLKESQVLRLRQKYEKGTLPIRPFIFAMIVDVQKETMKWTKVAFDRSGNLYVIDWGESVSWETVLEVAQSPVSTPDGEEFQILTGLVDEGDGNRAVEVRRFCLSTNDLFWPVKGRETRQIGKPLDTSKSVVDGQRVLTYHVHDQAFKKELLYDRIRGDRHNEEYGKPRLFLPRPRDVDPAFVEELLNEFPEYRKNKYGFEEEKWRKVGDNDFLDCLKYSLALWMILSPSLLAGEEEEEMESEPDNPAPV